jgi:molybdate transport system regulatory protein
LTAAWPWEEIEIMSDSKKSRRPRIEPRLKVWLELDGQYVFGHGLSEILQAVQAAGSMKQAAEQLGKSYRHVWARIKEAQTALGTPLVETRVGGSGSQRSVLTTDAEQLLAHFEALRSRLREVMEGEFASCFASRSRTPPTRVSPSVD